LATFFRVELYGQFAPEAFPSHYHYGLSMLEVARRELQELNASKVAPEDQPEGEDSDDDEESGDEGVGEVKEKADEEMGENGKEAKEAGQNEHEKEDEKMDQGGYTFYLIPSSFSSYYIANYTVKYKFRGFMNDMKGL
jgi:hypothetical protein